jgi:hypothetical protein
VLERRAYEDTPMKRGGILDRVSSGDIGSSSIDGASSKGLGDEFHTPWLLQSVATLEEYEVQRCGALIGEDDGAHNSGA